MGLKRRRSVTSRSDALKPASPGLPSIRESCEALFALLQASDKQVAISTLSSALPPASLCPHVTQEARDSLALAVVEAVWQAIRRDPFQVLPSDLVTHNVLTFFDIWELAAMRQVCRAWHKLGNAALASVQYAMLMRFERPPTPYLDETKWRASCVARRKSVLRLLAWRCQSLQTVAVSMAWDGYVASDVDTLVTACGGLTSLWFGMDTESEEELEDRESTLRIGAFLPSFRQMCHFLRVFVTEFPVLDEEAAELAASLPNLQALQIVVTRYPFSHTDELLTSRGLSALISGARSLRVLEIVRAARLDDPFPMLTHPAPIGHNQQQQHHLLNVNLLQHHAHHQPHDEGFEDANPRESGRALRRLKLESVMLTDQSLSSLLAEIGADLRTLNVTCATDVTDTCVRQIAENCPSLQHLALLGTRATPASIPSLASLELRLFAVAPDAEVEESACICESHVSVLRQQHGGEDEGVYGGRAGAGIGGVSPLLWVGGRDWQSMLCEMPLPRQLSFRSLVKSENVPVSYENCPHSEPA